MRVYGRNHTEYNDNVVVWEIVFFAAFYWILIGLSKFLRFCGFTVFDLNAVTFSFLTVVRKCDK